MDCIMVINKCTNKISIIYIVKCIVNIINIQWLIDRYWMVSFIGKSKKKIVCVVVLLENGSWNNFWLTLFIQFLRNCRFFLTWKLSTKIDSHLMIVDTKFGKLKSMNKSMNEFNFFHTVYFNFQWNHSLNHEILYYESILKYRGFRRLCIHISSRK